MHCILQLMRRIRQSREGHRSVLTGHGKTHSPAFAVANFRIPYLFLAAAFLRDKICRHIILHKILIDAELSPLLTVRIGLGRSEPIPFHMIIIGAQLEHHTELRHISQLFHRIIGEGRLHAAVPEYLVGNPALRRRYRTEIICERNFGAV